MERVVPEVSAVITRALFCTVEVTILLEAKAVLKPCKIVVGETIVAVVVE